MSILAKRFSSFFTSIYNYPSIQDDLNTKFTFVYENIDEILDDKFENKKKKFPKYKDCSKIIKQLSSYNVMRIYNVVSDGTKYLLETINKQHILTLKPNFDHMPLNRKNFIKDFYLQETYFTDIEDLYDKDVWFNLKNEQQRRNYYVTHFTSSFNSYLDDGSFIQIFSLHNLFNQTFTDSCNFLNKSIYYFSENDIINKTNIQNQFNDYIDNNHIDISKKLVSLIFKTIYQYPAVSQNIIDNLTVDISSKILNIKDIFKDFSDIFITDPVFELCQLTNKALSNISAVEITKDLFNNSNYFDQNIVQELVQIEDKIIRDFKSKISFSNIKQYLYMLFYYKFWPFKFLNVIPYVIRNYVENYLKPDKICPSLFVQSW